MSNDLAKIDAPASGESGENLSPTDHADALIIAISDGELDHLDPMQKHIFLDLHCALEERLLPEETRSELATQHQIDTLWARIAALPPKWKPFVTSEVKLPGRERPASSSKRYLIPLNLPPQGPAQIPPEAILTLDHTPGNPQQLTQATLDLKQSTETRPVFDPSHPLYYVNVIRIQWRGDKPIGDIGFIHHKKSEALVFSEDGSFDPEVHTIRYHNITKNMADVILSTISQEE